MAPTDQELETRLARLEAKLERFDDWRQTAMTAAALAAQNEAHYKMRFDKIDEELAEIKSAAWKIIWVVLGSFGASFVAWVIQGGLKVG